MIHTYIHTYAPREPRYRPRAPWGASEQDQGSSRPRPRRHVVLVRLAPTCVHAWLYVCMCGLSLSHSLSHSLSPPSGACASCTYMYTHNTYVCMYVCIYVFVCVCVCVYVCVYTHMHTHIHTHTHTHNTHTTHTNTHMKVLYARYVKHRAQQDGWRRLYLGA
jgi:uncharacterized membrane protein